MPLIKGKDIVLFSDTGGYTQGQGYFRRIEYHALRKERLYPKQAEFIDAGYNCVIDKMGNAPKWSLVATTAGPQDGGSEIPVERWTWRKELIQRDIFTKPEVAKEARQFSGTGGTNPAEYRKLITDAVERGTQLPSSLALKAQAPQVWLELTAGTDAYELEYLVLQRTKNTTQSFAPRIVLNATSYIYTTRQLAIAENIPGAVEVVLPGGRTTIGGNLATNPEPAVAAGNTMWGWRSRDHEGEYDGPVRFCESTTWVYAAWSTYLYTPA